MPHQHRIIFTISHYEAFLEHRMELRPHHLCILHFAKMLITRSNCIVIYLSFIFCYSPTAKCVILTIGTQKCCSTLIEKTHFPFQRLSVFELPQREQMTAISRKLCIERPTWTSPPLSSFHHLTFFFKWSVDIFRLLLSLWCWLELHKISHLPFFRII